MSARFRNNGNWFDDRRSGEARSYGSRLLYYAALGFADAAAGKNAAAEKILARLQQESRQRYVPSYLIAEIYVGLGEKDRAFKWLNRA